MRALAMVLVLVASASSVFAQRGQDARLVGTVRDATGAVLSDVSLTISSPQLIGGPRQIQTDARGEYRFISLLPGMYMISAERAGFQRIERRGLELVPGLTLTLDLQLDVAAIGAAMTASVPVLDVRSSASPVHISRHLLETLPMPLSRRVDDYQELAPGISGGVALGGAFLNTQISLDGTGGNDPQFGAPAAAPSFAWIDTVQIISVGAGAEHGEYTSARVNAVTRSGSNRFSGLFEAWGAPQQWTGTNYGSLSPQLAQQFRGSDLFEWWGTAAQAGGPIVRDRVWFFGGVDYRRLAYRPGSFSGPRPPGEPTVTIREPESLLKISAAPAKSMRVEGLLEREAPETRNFNAGPFVQPEAYAASMTRRDLANVRYTWWSGDRTLVEGRYGAFTSSSAQGPESPAARKGPSPRFDQATFVTSVNAGSFSETATRVEAAGATMTRFVDRGAGGGHELKIGLEHERSRRTSSVEYPGGALYLDRAGVPELVRFWDGERMRPRHHRTSFFVQDSWRVMERLTIEPGLRVGFYGSALPDVSMRLYENRSISPRLGLAWDVARDHRTVVRAHYGHFHDAMATGFYADFDPLAQSPTITARVLDDGTFEEVTRSGGSVARRSIDPDIKHSYAEEYVAGIEREVWPRVSVKAQYIRRNTRNAIGFIDTGSTWTPVTVTDPGRDGRLDTADDGPQMTVYYNHDPSAANFIMTNPEGAWRRYDAVQLVAGRRYAGVCSLEASYTWARTRGSFDNEHASNGASSDMATNGHFANPNRAIFTTGRTVYDRRHDLKVFGTYTLSYFGGLSVGGVYWFASGLPYGRIVNSFGPLTGGGPILVEPVGAYELPARNSVDLRLEKTFRLHGGTRIGVFGDLYNVNNQGVVERVNNGSGPNFGVPRGWTAPRKLRGGFRVVW